MTRREFLWATSAAAAAMAVPRNVFAHGSDALKIGLIGCGGRGTGAVVDCVRAAPGMTLWAMGDAFADRIAQSREHLKSLGDAVQVTDDRCFTGFDNYRGVIDSGVDMVILAAPPGFRPAHYEAAVAAGKHVFMEKPVAVDAPGVRRILAASEEARRKGLGVVAGTQRRHELTYREAIRRIHDGAIGDVVATYAYWNQGGLWKVDRREGMSDMEWQMRNWLYFTWLSGDHNVEQHIHNVDVCIWAKGELPVRATGLGGRQVRTDPVYGHVYDHFAIDYEFADGTHMMSFSRQIDGTDARVGEHIVGTKGHSNANTWIRGENPWRWDPDDENPNPYVLEQKNLIESIRRGEPLNEGRQIAETTLASIMGRMAAYTGKVVTWEMAMNSQEDLTPARLEFGPAPVAEVAMPGRTPFV